MNIEEANKLVLEAHQSFQTQQYEIARVLLQKTLDFFPKHSGANELLAYIIGNLGDKDSSHELLKIACEDPSCTPQALYYLGSSYLELNIPDQAIRFFSASINKGGNFFEGLHDLATAQAMVGNEKEAIENFKKAIALNPQSPEVFYNLGKAYDALKEYKEAVRCYDIAIQIWPDFAQAHFNKATALADLGLNELAVVEYRHAQSLKPDMEFLCGNLIHTEMKICDWDKLNSKIKGLMDAVNHTNHLISEPFSMISISNSEALNLRVASGFTKAKFLETKLDKKIHVNKNKKDKIHVGYFSADFHNHATAILMAEFFELHDKNRFHITAFSFGPVTNDDMHNRVKIAFDEFIEVQDKSDESIANLSQNLGIDIAIDLKGYTQDGRPKIFSYRAAPIQISYLGYPGTLGASYMDYIIADPIIIPESNREFYTEKIIYLPNCYQANDSKRAISSQVLSRSEAGLPKDGFVFCCFNQNYKITPQVFDCWMQILHKVDKSVLWLLEDSVTAVANLKKEALAQGISPERLIFAKRMQLPEHLARHQLADVFLDTLPYNAHTTASDALWAGLPVLTCIGKTFPGRVAASLLKAVGLSELITNTHEEYIDLAINLANNPQRLRTIRNKLAENRLSSPLFDSTLFTKHLEAGFQKAYDRYHDGLAPDNIFIEQ
jgi:predicted O-linked N-acetylglucosamine transferase (SPINDLY family)